MTDKQNTLQVANDLVVTFDYVLKVDGEVVDSSEEDGPLDYLHGYANIISGLERQLTGMKVGESKKVVVAPEEGYGVIESDAITEIPRKEFSGDIPLELGVELEMTDEDNDLIY